MRKSDKNRIFHPEEAKLWHKIAKTTKPLSKEKLDKLLDQIETTTKEVVKFENSQSQKKLKAQIVHRPIKSENIKPNPPPIADISNQKKPRRGKLNIDATIDLHGFNQEMAEQKLEAFILNSLANNYKNLLVITGKGHDYRAIEKNYEIFEAPRGILRMRFKDWLHKPHLRKYIAGISQSNQKHGGAGAYYVILKSRTE